VIFVAFKILGKKNGLELVHIDPVRIASRRFQVKKKFVGEEIITIALQNLLIAKTRNDLASDHDWHLLSVQVVSVQYPINYVAMRKSQLQ
jgi:hypothetical protein